ncbi:hypothetical protein HOE37_00280 [Candidatus Woesearchaeota archaeon]|nr:hypothetical protein [Candidatus Woesearchaeota archaeon]MBT4336203.1 hypothetical protein [Candidatus Woesearchaeota archaeon]MBT4468818.1 hypothetical protein [Candidatus Woesearchaeota archaeon]MBT6744863.1 hypothetical protein [Candidatus Woesearchaeota archaeon]
MKKLLSIMALFVISLLTLSMVSALDANDLVIKSIEVNGHNVEDGEVLAVEEGETLDVEVGLLANAGAENIEVEVEISGYEYNDQEDMEATAHIDNIQAGNTKYFDLEVTLPKKLDKDEYMLRVRVMDKNTAAITHNILLSIEPTRHGIDIADVALSPGETQKAGRSFLATVLLENFGDKTEKDVKVEVAIPALGVKATEYVDVVVTDNNNVDYEDVPEMFLPLPATAEAGAYDMIVTVKYDDLRETVSQTYKVNVLANELFQKSDKLVLAVGPESQTVAAGNTASYAVALTNAGSTSKAYVLDVVTGDWATATVSDALVVLEPGKNKVVQVDVTAASNAVEGQHVASVAIMSGDEVLETIVLKANVAGTASESFSLRNGLEIALIVLVVLLVIIGLIIGFSRLRKDDEDEEEQTYY